jgi:hypothetical protein
VEAFDLLHLNGVVEISSCLKMERPATFQDLSDAYRASLQRRGILDKVRAELRAEMFHMLQGDPNLASIVAARPSSGSSSNNAIQECCRNPSPLLPLEYFMINEMVHEFLCFHGLRHTASVLEAEAKIRKEDCLGREFIEKELNICTRNRFIYLEEPLPLLYDLTRNQAITKKDFSNEYELNIE